MNNGGQGAGWPSTTGNPSGGNRGNNPPKTSNGGSKPAAPKK